MCRLGADLPYRSYNQSIHSKQIPSSVSLPAFVNKISHRRFPMPHPPSPELKSTRLYECLLKCRMVFHD